MVQVSKQSIYIYNFLSYFVNNQIRLNQLMDDCHPKLKQKTNIDSLDPIWKNPLKRKLKKLGTIFQQVNA
jgi:hypothetical protein